MNNGDYLIILSLLESKIHAYTHQFPEKRPRKQKQPANGNFTIASLPK